MGRIRVNIYDIIANVVVKERNEDDIPVINNIFVE